MRYLQVILIFLFVSCQAQPSEDKDSTEPPKKETETIAKPFDSSTTTLHVFVALCDNQYLGIVPVSKALGNGKNPNTNLYWVLLMALKPSLKKVAIGNF